MEDQNNSNRDSQDEPLLKISEQEEEHLMQNSKDSGNRNNFEHKLDITTPKESSIVKSLNTSI